MSGDRGAHASERERVLTETLLVAREQIVALRDHLLDLGAGDPAYVFGHANPSEAAWQVWDAMMMDAEERGEGRVLASERITTLVRWSPSPRADGGAS